MSNKERENYLAKEEVTIRSDLNSKNIFHSTPFYAGDSVDQHKQLEEVNEMFSEKEIKQSNENS
ncbi:hypothetical protein BKP45_20910 [Anaerobacillus alkalidiazotrophicus]|uniref:Uncharacterized protein n=1 Tax=Anaerobacillus alkalidiazotrophicus TaxID=472963 RepID=A0A1S2LX83_9BACI|nr:hypothetical protein [Anaerobacillus alkalidiazotrophicus]OIJ16956.1 hypothetical protein BKP45_20910 [Anaerobacillus alkalidiazotrophicus]